ncbi:MAG: EAL domain-containing protein [Kangiellaceae bacterium]|nr:EAL domain-containing protein [Kangiellaceae bacterium]
MKISIKTIFTLSSVSSFAFAFLLVYGVFGLSDENKALRSIEKETSLMQQLARDLKQSSNNLTRYARLYVNTSVKEYKEIYFRILDIRSGKAERLKQYCSIYWVLPEPLRSNRHPLTEPSSLKSEMSKLPYSGKEFELLRKSEENSNKLSGMELKAFSILEEAPENSDGHTIKRTKSNSDIAIKLLTSQEYRLAKEGIMIPIDDFLHSLASRTKASIISHEKQIEASINYLLLLLLLALIIISLSIYLIWMKVISPIDYLTKVITTNKVTNVKIRKELHHNDEMGFMIESFFAMKKSGEDDFKRLEFALRAGHQGWFDLNVAKGHVVVSAQYAKLIGLPEKQYIADLGEWRNGIHPDDRDKVLNSLTASVDEHRSGEVEFRRFKKDGEIIWLRAFGEVVEWTDTGKPMRLIGIAADVTDSKKQQKELESLAHFDGLTKLPNRNLFADRFTHAVAHCKRSNTQLAICYLDLDDFKPINDQFGHATGDQLLVQVAQRIKSCIREEDTVSRQGGDEFTLLLGDIHNYSECEITMRRIHDELSKPFVINELTHTISASSGVTIYPQDAGEIDTLLRHSDNAMYQAKIAGKNRFALFNPEKDEREIYKHGRLAEIESALNNQELSLHYQPKVNMRTGEVYGVEALIRWQHPEKGMIAPLEFLPIIERTNLEIRIGNWVIEQALKQLTEWNKQNIDLEVSVNIASYHLQSSSFVSSLEKLLNKYSHICPDKLQLEILETSVLSDLNTVSNVIIECREELGISIALDDFGTGYSSLTHLRHLSASTIKIDRTFVRDVLDDPGDYAIINGVIGLANSFDRVVIAEGVEYLEQGYMLLLMNCERAQGYAIAKPMPVTELVNWLSNYQANQQWIDFAATARTNKQRELEIVRLGTAQWQNLFMKNISSSEILLENLPIMDPTKCICGAWIRKAIQDHLFEQDWLDKIDHIHNNIHAYANDLIDEYKSNSGKVKKSNIERLEATFDLFFELVEEKK